jgi:hypothetical protein
MLKFGSQETLMFRFSQATGVMQNTTLAPWMVEAGDEEGLAVGMDVWWPRRTSVVTSPSARRPWRVVREGFGNCLFLLPIRGWHGAAYIWSNARGGDDHHTTDCPECECEASEAIPMLRP